MPLLTVENLNVGFRSHDSVTAVSSGVSFTVDRGRVLGIIGESGSGKTVTCKAILRLLPQNAVVTSDRMEFLGRDIAKTPERDFRSLRGSSLAMIFQDPVGSFNPVKTVGWHFRHVAGRRETSFESAAAIDEAAGVNLKQAGIVHATDVLGAYPHQLSGGMLQRCLIGLVLFMKPKLIVADEPTTNLDNIVERQIIDLLVRLRDEIDASIVFITHDMSIAKNICDDIVVMYGGQIVERASAHDVLSSPHHPYTRGLIRNARELSEGVETLTEIPGDPASGLDNAGVCRFIDRCSERRDVCRRSVDLLAIEPGRDARCIRAAAGDLADG